MSRFANAWLALREPYDRVARSAALADRFAQALGAAPRVADLGCGTGANLRYLAPRLAAKRAEPQHWLCLDRDSDLLVEADAALGAWRSEVGWRGTAHFEACDLATGLPAPALEGTAVTASAFLDLTSAAWLDRLAGGCRRNPILIALSFDGRLAWHPILAEDELIRARFNQHQRTDKGFGPALGPDAAAHLADRLDARGHRVSTATSDWRLGPSDRALVEAMLDGVLAAAAAISQDRTLERWAIMRRQDLARDALGLTVGHLELLALPEGV